MSEEIRKISEAEWSSDGERRFGKDRMKWKFICPNCGNIQSPEDFKKYKDKGAKPDTAYFNCIGRFMDKCEGTMLNNKSPCNYTLGGLINFVKTIVISEDGKETHVFEFAPEEKPKKCTMCNELIPPGKERMIMYRPYCQKCGKVREKRGAPFASSI